MSGTERGTILYGMMGSGKSTLGEGLAAHLGQPFTETDLLIEERFGANCGELVAAGNFPDQQVETILDFRPTTAEVVATGGSVATYPELVEHLGKYGVGIFIDVDAAILEHRLSPERIAALNNPNKLSFRKLYRERMERYQAAADYTLHVVTEAPETTLERLIHLREQIA